MKVIFKFPSSELEIVKNIKPNDRIFMVLTSIILYDNILENLKIKNLETIKGERINPMISFEDNKIQENDVILITTEDQNQGNDAKSNLTSQDNLNEINNKENNKQLASTDINEYIQSLEKKVQELTNEVILAKQNNTNIIDNQLKIIEQNQKIISEIQSLNTKFLPRDSPTVKIKPFVFPPNNKFINKNNVEVTNNLKTTADVDIQPLDCCKDKLNEILLYVDIFEQDKPDIKYNENIIDNESTKANINKKVYFLCDKENKIDKSFDMLDEDNTEMYVDGEQQKFSKFHIFDKPGEHKVRYVIKNKVLESCENLFRNCYYITKINLSKFISDSVTNLNFMFCNCKSLRKVTLADFKTEKVTTMFGLFSCCFKIKELSLDSFNTPNVVNMDYFFNSCFNLKNLYIKNLDMGKVKEKNWMFLNCEKLINIVCSEKCYDIIKNEQGYPKDVAKVTKVKAND